MTASGRLADALARFVFEGAAVRGALVSVDEACRDILACHPYPPALRRVIAELLAAAALLASTLKFRGSLIVQLQGKGPVRMLVVECDATLALRATAQWNREAEMLEPAADLFTLAGPAGDARLVITLDPKDGGPLYQGIVGLEAASVATLIEHYLTSSEQIESRLFVDASGTTSRGVLLQRLPSAGPGDDAVWENVAQIARALSPADFAGSIGTTSWLAAHFGDRDVRVFEPRPVRFACTCSADRIAGALRMLGRAEVESILTEQGMVGVTCEFCNRHYSFVASDARALFERESNAGDAATATTPSAPAH